MKYKAVIFDIDGTAVRNAQHAKPSKLLIDTVQKAKSKAYVCAATGRIYATAKWVIDPLQLTAPCIISSGAQIIDPKTLKILWQKNISYDDVVKIMGITAGYPYIVTAASQYDTFPPKKEVVIQDESIIYVLEVQIKDSAILLNKLQKISSIAVHQVVGYAKGTVTFDITHRDATKSHALHKLIDILGVQKQEIIGVGDSYNDLPLFEAVGLKIAIGNAASELKEAADEIAPSVQDDGLAYVIQKYILTE